MASIALLRGINISGQKKIAMNDLKKVFESLKLKNVQTYIQSGNVLFEGTIDAKTIEKKIQEVFGFQVTVFLRSKEELRKVIAKNPFAGKDPNYLYVTFLSDTPKETPEITKDKAEEFIISGKEVYLYCPKGYGRTKLNNNLFERKLKLQATTRNWKTINKLVNFSLL